jgi:hypothetical protein
MAGSWGARRSCTAVGRRGARPCRCGTRRPTRVASSRRWLKPRIARPRRRRNPTPTRRGLAGRRCPCRWGRPRCAVSRRHCLTRVASRPASAPPRPRSALQCRGQPSAQRSFQTRADETPAPRRAGLCSRACWQGSAASPSQRSPLTGSRRPKLVTLSSRSRLMVRPQTPYAHTLTPMSGRVSCSNRVR